MTKLLESLATLETAEEFLDRFGIPFEQRVVDVHRLHILQRMHDRLAVVDLASMDEGCQSETIAAALAAAYQDFVYSDARTEKVFRIFHRPAAGGPAGKTVIPLADIRGAEPRA